MSPFVVPAAAAACTDTTVPVSPGVAEPPAVAVVVMPGVPGRGVGDGVGVAPGEMLGLGVVDAEGVGEASGVENTGVEAERSMREGADTTGVKSARTLDASVGFIAVTGSIVMPSFEPEAGVRLGTFNEPPQAADPAASATSVKNRATVPRPARHRCNNIT